MPIFYLAERGFLHSELNGDIPEEAVAVTAEAHQALLDAQAQGQVIQAGPDGHPVAVDLVVPDAELARRVRAQRDRLLAESDWVVTRSVETGAPVGEAWLSYRAWLRDVPSQSGFPGAVVWPPAPDA